MVAGRQALNSRSVMGHKRPELRIIFSKKATSRCASKSSIFRALTHPFAGAVSLTPHAGAFISPRAVWGFCGRSSVG